MILFRFLIAGAVVLSLVNCGGGGTPNTTLQSTGYFLDAAVEGVSYRTNTTSGTTGKDGSFKYVDGESVIFSIGNISLPSVKAANKVTPFDIAGSTDINDHKVVNLLVFLQSIDKDGDPSNGIEIEQVTASNATSALDFKLPKASFRNQAALTKVIEAARGLGALPRSEVEVKTHFQTTISSNNLVIAPVGGGVGECTGNSLVVGAKAPLVSGTIFMDPKIITESDPSSYLTLVPKGQGQRTMFDRRVNAFVQLQPFLFDATFSDGLSAEVQVNPEFGSVEAARIQAEKYALVIGRLPKALRLSVKSVWIHQGVQPFGGGNNNLLIHVGQGDLYIADGILEETLIHEAAHTSLDSAHAASSCWLRAQANDENFISTYARDNPTREDIAESFLPYLAVRYRASRITSTLANEILQTIPNRIAYFDSLGLEMLPVK